MNALIASALQQSLSAALDLAFASQPAAKLYFAGPENFTYGQLRDSVGRTLRLFADMRLAPGDRIAVATERDETLVMLLLAALRAGLTVVPLNPEQTPAELNNQLAWVEPRCLFADGAIGSGVDREKMAPPFSITPIAARDTNQRGLLGRFLRPAAPAETDESAIPSALQSLAPLDPPGDVDPHSVAVMLFTSGTTSEPKVVQLTRDNLRAQMFTFLAVHGHDETSRVLNILPLHHTDGIMLGPLVSLLAGATLYRPFAFSIPRLPDLMHAIYRDRITHLVVVPTILALIARLGGEFDDAFRTPDFRFIMSSADYLHEALWREVQERFGVMITNAYGLTETVSEAVYCGPQSDTFKLGTIGKPIDCEIRIVGKDGGPVAAGEPGELAIRGANVMAGYFRQPEATAEAIKEGWLHTGDLARVDEEGFVSIVGRTKTVIICGGANIHPQTVTAVLLTHSKVSQAVTFGLPDPIWGEVVACAIVPRPDMAVSVDEIMSYCQDQISPRHQPRVVRIVAELPKNPAGKVLVDQLKASFVAKASGAAQDGCDNVEEAVLTIAARIFNVENTALHLTSTQDDTVGWDSLNHLTLVLEAEKRFGVALSARDILSFRSLAELAACIRARQGQGNRHSA